MEQREFEPSRQAHRAEMARAIRTAMTLWKRFFHPDVGRMSPRCLEALLYYTLDPRQLARFEDDLADVKQVAQEVYGASPAIRDEPETVLVLMRAFSESRSERVLDALTESMHDEDEQARTAPSLTVVEDAAPAADLSDEVLDAVLELGWTEEEAMSLPVETMARIARDEIKAEDGRELLDEDGQLPDAGPSLPTAPDVDSKAVAKWMERHGITDLMLLDGRGLEDLRTEYAGLGPKTAEALAVEMERRGLSLGA